jgi:hypothetical protein
MAENSPFDQITGTLAFYVGPVGEAVPDVSAAPAGNWYFLGFTDGEQVLTHAGPLTKFYINEAQGPQKAVRPQEDPVFTFGLVQLTLETWATVLSQAANVTAAAGPPAIKSMPLKRGRTPTEYALLARGSTQSPYAALPAQVIIPRGSFDDEPTPTFAKDGRAMLECQFMAWEDTTVAAADSLGWIEAQTA